MFTKLFSSITDSTIWREPDHVRLVWITMLAKCDKHGIVYASVPGLADAARVDMEHCQDALLRLAAPDPWSRSKEEDGRRIIEVDGGWMLVNHAKYKRIKDADERRAYIAEKVAEYRAKQKDVNNVNNVNSCKPGKHIRSDQIRSDKEEASAKASAASLRIPIEAREIILPEKFQTTRFCEMWFKWISYRKKKKRSGDWRILFRIQLDSIKEMSESEAFKKIETALAKGWLDLVYDNATNQKPHSIEDHLKAQGVQ